MTISITISKSLFLLKVNTCYTQFESSVFQKQDYICNRFVDETTWVAPKKIAFENMPFIVHWKMEISTELFST